MYTWPEAPLQHLRPGSFHTGPRSVNEGNVADAGRYLNS